MGILLCEPGYFVSCTCGCVMFGLGGLLCCFFLCCLLFFLSGLMQFVIMIKTKQNKKLLAEKENFQCQLKRFTVDKPISMVFRGVSPVTTGVNVTPKHLLFFLRQKIQIQHLILRLHMNKANSCIY